MKLQNIPPELTETKSKGFRSKILIGVVVGLLFEIGGYFLLRGNQTAFGWVMFIGVPTVMGFAVSLFTQTKWQTFWGILLTFVIGIVFFDFGEMGRLDLLCPRFTIAFSFCSYRGSRWPQCQSMATAKEYQKHQQVFDVGSCDGVFSRSKGD